jgi:hypothetical protein
MIATARIAATIANEMIICQLPSFAALSSLRDPESGADQQADQNDSGDYVAEQLATKFGAHLSSPPQSIRSTIKIVTSIWTPLERRAGHSDYFLCPVEATQ